MSFLITGATTAVKEKQQQTYISCISKNILFGTAACDIMGKDVRLGRNVIVRCTVSASVETLLLILFKIVNNRNRPTLSTKDSMYEPDSSFGIIASDASSPAPHCQPENVTTHWAAAPSGV
jgi:hypothetical protein